MNCKDHLRPSREELHRVFITEQVFRHHVAARYGVSEQTLIRWLRHYQIECPRKGRRKKYTVTDRTRQLRAKMHESTETV
jgi:transposase